MIYNTEKRNELIDFFKKSHGQAYTVDEIASAILPDAKGKSTLYRLISKMVDEGRVRRISDGKTRHVTYQYIHSDNCAEHMHLKCKVCGSLIHLDGGVSNLLENRIMTVEGFEVDEGAVVYGKCKNCKRKELNK